jgi:hypothetical protein
MFFRCSQKVNAVFGKGNIGNSMKNIAFSKNCVNFLTASKKHCFDVANFQIPLFFALKETIFP